MIGFKQRRWRIVFYKRELQPDGRIADVEVSVFENAEPLFPDGDLRDKHGRIVFRTAEGKEVIAGGVAYLAEEV
jgi:hypothetical protein